MTCGHKTLKNWCGMCAYKSLKESPYSDELSRLRAENERLRNTIKEAAELLERRAIRLHQALAEQEKE